MRFLIVAALCAIASAAPEGRRLRPEEHWRPAQGRHGRCQRRRLDGEDQQGGRRDEGRLPIQQEGPRTAQGCVRHRGSRCQGGKDRRRSSGYPPLLALAGGSLHRRRLVLRRLHHLRELRSDRRPLCRWRQLLRRHGRSSQREGVQRAKPCRGDLLQRLDPPSWNSNDLSGDLALVELPSPLPMNDFISASCLPATGETPAVGSMVTVTGWGKPSDSAGGISPVLREVRDIPVMTNADCNAVYGIVGDGVVCIDTAGGRGSCNGDSGGPLVQKAGGKAAGDQWTQVGIVSFGASAGCEVGMPAGFTRTEYYLDWIKSETGMP